MFTLGSVSNGAGMYNDEAAFQAFLGEKNVILIKLESQGFPY